MGGIMPHIRGRGLDDHKFWVKPDLRFGVFGGSPTQIWGVCCHIGAADLVEDIDKICGSLEGGLMSGIRGEGV